MHSYLIVGRNPEELEEKIKTITSHHKLYPFVFPVEKKGDVKDLNSLVRLSFNKPTAVIIKNAPAATDEAQNALLKNLEEPQENIFFFLTCESTLGLLPTIVSRCQILYLKGTHPNEKPLLYKEFLFKSQGEKLSIVSKLNDKESAINFTRQFIISAREEIKNEKTADYALYSRSVKNAIKTHSALIKNGNVNLQLTSFVLSLV